MAIFLKRRFGNTSKYGAKRVTYAHHSFASKLEASCFGHLNMMQAEGILTEIECQQTIRMTRANITWRADFKFIHKQHGIMLAEAKGHETETWLLKLKLYRVYGPYPLWILKGSYANPYLHEEIFPEDWKKAV